VGLAIADHRIKPDIDAGRIYLALMALGGQGCLKFASARRGYGMGCDHIRPDQAASTSITAS